MFTPISCPPELELLLQNVEQQWWQYTSLHDSNNCIKPLRQATANSHRYSAMVLRLARSTSGRQVVVSSPLAAGCRVATVGQLLFAPWAWAYSTLHPLGVGKWVPAIAGKV